MHRYLHKINPFPESRDVQLLAEILILLLKLVASEQISAFADEIDVYVTG